MPDLGSWLAIKANEKGYREYIGFSDDVLKLPHYVAHGSSALCLDTGELYRFHQQTDTWYRSEYSNIMPISKEEIENLYKKEETKNE